MGISIWFSLLNQHCFVEFSFQTKRFEAYRKLLASRAMDTPNISRFLPSNLLGLGLGSQSPR